jgi:hypothetical protein
MECALGLSDCAEGCVYHEFLRDILGNKIDVLDVAKLPEIRRMLSIRPPTVQSTEAPKLQLAGRIQPRALISSSTQTHSRRLANFLKLIDHLGTAPWANLHFEVNHKILMRLTASHLNLISPGCPQGLTNLIDPRLVLDGAANLVWITNRQQGKTTTLARFVAAMALASPVGGLLFTVYSTSLDRSVELVKAAKAYIYWVQSEESGRIEGFSDCKLMRDNERMFAVLNSSKVTNNIVARPKNPESCRGDAPHAAIFDEVGFIGRKLWDSFAYPLLQVRNRIFTCATTPPPPNSFFAIFAQSVRERNEEGDFFFRLINHSLSCQTCLDAGEAMACAHNLAFLPPWKSMVTLRQMANLVADRETYQAEVYGVMLGAGAEYIPTKLIEAAVARERVTTPFMHTHVWVAIDPPAHGTSELGICAFAMNESGVHVILALCAVNMARAQTTEVQMVLHQLLGRLRVHNLVRHNVIITPIIECNNNEILVMSLLSVFHQYPPIEVPFTEENFSTAITDGIGVWMTQENKQASIQVVYQALFDGRVSFAENLVVADRTAFVPTSMVVDPAHLIKKLSTQLRAMQDQPDGTISGKHLGCDDLACALMLGFYWSLCARAAAMRM